MKKKKERKAILDPSLILKSSHGYWVSQVLYVAVKLKIFTKLSGKRLMLKDIAAALKVPSHSIERLLNACCALRFLIKDKGTYHNSRLSEKFLVEGKKEYLGNLVLLTELLYKNWGSLLESIKKDRPADARVSNIFKRTGNDIRLFTLAMNSGSSLTAPYLAKAVNLSGNKRLLDLGGGSGVNSIVLAEKNPRLEAVVYDTPSVTKIADEFIAHSSVSKRVRTIAGDFEKERLPGGFDCVLLSHILHGAGEKASRNILKKCYDILEPSGKIIILEFLLNENKDGPVTPALFALNMLVETAQGNAFTAGEIRQFLRDSGFKVKSIQRLAKWSPVSLVLGIKE